MLGSLMTKRISPLGRFLRTYKGNSKFQNCRLWMRHNSDKAKASLGTATTDNSFISPGTFIFGVTALFCGYQGYHTVLPFIYKQRAMWAENKLLTMFVDEGVEPNLWYFFVYAKLSGMLLDRKDIIQHCGELRFATETLKMVPINSTNELVITFNAYGTKRVGLVTAWFKKEINEDGLLMLVPTYFSLDTWDGTVFEWDVKEGGNDKFVIDGSEAYTALLRKLNKERKGQPRHRPKAP